MAVFYLDASALLKRYRTEKGTEIVDDIYDGRGEQHIILTSQLTCIEVESVAARARKGGILNDREYKTLLGAFSGDLAEGLRLVAIGPERLVEAAEIVREVPLRSLDAIHYTVVRRLNILWGSHPFVFVGSDRELLDACQANGIEYVDPEATDALEKLKVYRMAKKEAGDPLV
jgi:predicted nucleic acid-binding protein